MLVSKSGIESSSNFPFSKRVTERPATTLDCVCILSGRSQRLRLGALDATVPQSLEPFRKTVHIEVNHRCGVKRERLADNQSANDRDAQRPPQLESGSASER